MTEIAEVESDDDSGQSTGTERGERSATRYPFFDLEEAEKFAKAVHDSGGKEIREDELLAFLKVSRTTKSWIYKLSTAREFGLIERKGQKGEARIILTDLAQRLLLPGDDTERTATRISAFLTPPIYQKIFERYLGTMPQVDLLANILVREHKLVDSVAEPAAIAFIASARYAGVVNGNVLNRPKPGGALPEPPPPPLGNEVLAPEPPGFIRHTYLIRGGKMEIALSLPRDLNQKDVARISKWLATLAVDDDEGGGSPA